MSTVNQIITEALLNKTNRSPLKTNKLRIFLEVGRGIKTMKTMNDNELNQTSEHLQNHTTDEVNRIDPIEALPISTNDITNK